MNEPVWLTDDLVRAIHEELIAEFGGLVGLRDSALLASALARPKNIALYESPALFDLAAAHAYGIARNHPFADGNKRTALMAAYVFLRLNGLRLQAPEVEAAATFRALAADEIGESDLAVWIGENAEPV